MSVVQAFKITANGANKCSDFVFQINHDFRNQGSLRTISSKANWLYSATVVLPKTCQRQRNNTRFTPLLDRKNRTGCFQDDILGRGTEHQFADL